LSLSDFFHLAAEHNSNTVRSPRISKESRHELVRSAFRLNAENLGRRVVSGASFTFLGIALRTFITLGSTAILARLLTPADFGHVAMAAVVTEFTGLFGGFGFANLLIQRKTITRLQMDTVFWASVIIGLILTGVVFILAPLASWVFANETTGALLRLLCFSFLLNSLTVVHEATLSRLMRFRTEFWILITVIGVRSSVAIVFAYLGFGVWSLVIGPLFGAAASIALYYSAIPYLPRFRFHPAYLKATWKVSGSYFGSNILYYLNMNVDLLLIGRSLGATPLGYYQNARSLTDEIRGRIAMPLQRVLFPAFSALQNDQKRLQTSVMRAGRLLAAIIIPVGVGLSAIAQDLVPVLYGPQWLAMIPLLSMFGISGAIRGATAISSSLFNAMNQVPLAFKYNTIGTLLTASAIIVTLPYGIEAVTLAVMLSNLYALVTFRIGLGLIGLHTRHMLDILGYPTLAATGMWIAVILIRTWTKEWINDAIILLLLHIFLGATFYISALLITSINYYKDVIIFIKSQTQLRK
jgi:O-antigen/teichoic acid export membrane protein